MITCRFLDLVIWQSFNIPSAKPVVLIIRKNGITGDDVV